jgi:hypothetical protein
MGGWGKPRAANARRGGSHGEKISGPNCAAPRKSPEEFGTVQFRFAAIADVAVGRQEREADIGGASLCGAGSLAADRS